MDSKDLVIKIDKLTGIASKVTIKVGTFGDQALSSILMDAIQENVNSTKN